MVGYCSAAAAAAAAVPTQIPTEYTASLTLKELNITGATAKVTDVWTGEDAGAVANGEWSTGVVPGMDSRFVVFSS